MRTSSKRLGRLRNAIDALPVRTGVLREAYEWFVMSGELPDDDHVAFEVVQRALRGGEDAPVASDELMNARMRQARVAYLDRTRTIEEWPPSVRTLLFDEALFEIEPLRNVARAAIAAEVAWGGDVESMGFAARHGIPGYGSIAMHVCGYPAKLAVAPFEDQAKRLFVRIDNLRGRVPHDAEKWGVELDAAIRRCRATGELPVDDVMGEAVLAEVELGLLRRHRAGKDVADAMAVLDQIAKLEGDDLAAAVKRLPALACAGML